MPDSVSKTATPAIQQPDPLLSRTVRAQREPDPLWVRLLAPISSLKLTVVLFALSIFIVFAGTVAQVDKGIWTIVHDYFRTAFAYIPLSIFFPRSWKLPAIGFYFPGGWLIGGMLLTNLLAAHAVRFKVKARGRDLTLGLVVLVAGILVTWLVMSNHVQELMDWAFPLQTAGRGDAFWRVLWRLTQGAIAAAILYAGCLLLFNKRAGIVLLHGGVILMLCSELITGLFAVESRMVIAEGETVNFVDQSQRVELAVIDPSDPSADNVISVSQRALTSGKPIHSVALPFDIEVKQWMRNSSEPIPLDRVGPPMKAKNKATAGFGARVLVLDRSEGTGVDTGASEDVPSAFIELKKKSNGQSLGVYTVSLWFYPNTTHRQLASVFESNYGIHVDPDLAQVVDVDGKKYKIALRPQREYLASSAGDAPFSLHLNKFNHKVYVGTDTPSDYSSEVRLVDPARGVDREVKIWMNNPLRYAGRTFYQSSFLPGDTGTVLQVVKNVGWMVPYVSCMIIAMGMIGHLGNHLLEFLRKRAAA
jgi:hypothetical protein